MTAETANSLDNPLMDRITIDPRYFEKPLAQRMCQGCGVRRAQHEHHREHKAMGGRHGAAKAFINREENLIDLCEICHMASHLEHGVAADGFECAVCPKLKTCYWGRKTLGFVVTGMTPNW